MPNRIIKESICTSDNIDQLSAFQETFFYRLMVNCDDYGRMDARSKILASKLFPLKDIRTTQIDDALRALTSAELVILYEVDGKPFLQMKTWDKHQQIRAKKSKYPSPDAGQYVNMISNDINCNQMKSDASKCPRNPIQYESESNPNTNTKAAALSERFSKFWASYPRHQDRKKAEDAFRKINPDDELLAKMISAIEKQKKSSQWQDPQFIPHPTTWLHGKRWEDEVTQAKAKDQNTAHYANERQYTQDNTVDDFIARHRMELEEIDEQIRQQENHYGGRAV